MCVRRREPRIERDRPFQVPLRAGHRLGYAPTRVVKRLEIMLVRLQIGTWRRAGGGDGDKVTCRAAVIAVAISSCTVNTSASCRSKRSDQRWLPSAAAMSCAVTRIRSPALRTLPSKTVVTPRARAILRTSSCLPLKAKADVRAITFRPGILARRLMIHSPATGNALYQFALPE